jgi:hypothetical protein
MSEEKVESSDFRPRPEAGRAEGPGTQQRPRRAYSSPQLIAWGSLVDLTRGGSGAAMDYDFVTTKAV